MVDDADKAAVEEEVEENAEMFSILKERYRAPKLPIVFCHGLFGESLLPLRSPCANSRRRPVVLAHC